jgi:hypothetical protein
MIEWEVLQLPLCEMCHTAVYWHANISKPEITQLSLSLTAKHSSNLSNSTCHVTSQYCRKPGELENQGFKPCSSLDFYLYHCIWTGSKTNPTSHPTSTSISL